MGIMDKVKFWDDEDDLDLDSELPPLDSEEPSGDFNPQDFGNPPSMENRQSTEDMPGQNDYPDLPQQQSQQQMQGGFNQGTTGDISRDLELISSKLDTIKAELDSMDQRIRKIEKIAEGEAGSQKSRTRASKDPWSNY